MKLETTFRNEIFRFGSLAEVMAKANEPKSGDQLAGIAAGSARERVAAKSVLADTALTAFIDHPLIDPAHDDVARLIAAHAEASERGRVAGMTVGSLREYILTHGDDPDTVKDLARNLTPDMVAACAKIMSNQDLIVGASRVRNISRCRSTMGGAEVLGIRLQPNHPTDSIKGILASTVDGLSYGCGDAVIGVNPATESVDTVRAIVEALNHVVQALKIPTQVCCLSHITTQLAVLEHGTPVHLLFQSIAGTEAANNSFGINIDMLRAGREQVLAAHKTDGQGYIGEQVMYFETGQGSALSAGAHHGLDQVTLEARAYGVARAFDPFLVNSVVGFIGPEYLADERQIIRAGLEDHFMGKILGLPMGVDVCYTNHADADQNTIDNLLVLLTSAGCNFFMGVPSGDDVMLSYQSSSFHDGASMRRLFGKRPTPEFERWFGGQDIVMRGAQLLDGVFS